RYPECKGTKPVSIGVACPREGCGGVLPAKRSKRGKGVYGWSHYSKTKGGFVSVGPPNARAGPPVGRPVPVQEEPERRATGPRAGPREEGAEERDDGPLGDGGVRLPAARGGGGGGCGGLTST